jgi:8-oxo-dGTP diphosphatase
MGGFMICIAYEFGYLKKYKYVVIFAHYQNKWIVCKHKDRDTWETSGGHIENNEIPIEAAKREFMEETGALDFEITPVCDYWASNEPNESKHSGLANGQVFFAKVNKIGKIPQNSEMECIKLFDEFPEKLTYPEITKEILPLVIKKINSESSPNIA